MYSVIRLLADVMIIMPTTLNNTSTGNSNRAMPCFSFQSSDRINVSAAPARISTLLNVLKGSTTNRPE